MSEEMYEVGKIVNTHGIKGEVRVISTTDFSERFTVGKILYLVNKNDPAQKLVIDGHRMHKQFDLIHFEGFDTINDVEHFKGAHLKIKEEQLTDLNKGEYYYHQIVGCIMYTTSGEELGTITEILSPGANDVWVVKRPTGKEVLIPAIKDVIMEVDIAEKTVIIELMEGLLD